jgi:predicted transposase YbfD/YdcC
VATPKGLQHVSLQEVIVMEDAMHTQREISDQIVVAGGDYLFPLKAVKPGVKSY